MMENLHQTARAPAHRPAAGMDIPAFEPAKDPMIGAEAASRLVCRRLRISRRNYYYRFHPIVKLYMVRLWPGGHPKVRKSHVETLVDHWKAHGWDASIEGLIPPEEPPDIPGTDPQ